MKSSNKSKILGQQKVFQIPYFSHQELNPQLYGLALCLPVSTPKWPPGIVPETQFEDEASSENDNTLDYQGGKAQNDNKTKKRRKVQSKKACRTYKRLKLDGVRPAIAKKVTADLDSDDQRIVDLKEAGHLEKGIAEILIQEKRTQYNAKTIGTRWARLKKVRAKRNDELLDANETDWHDGDNEALDEAIRRVNAIMIREVKKLENRRWKWVADNVKMIKPVTNFSGNACQQRCEALRDGSAKVTPESIANPDQATMHKIERRQKRQRKIDATLEEKLGGEKAS